MKASLIVLAPLACFMQGSLAAPTPAVAAPEVRAVSTVDAPVTNEVAERRDLLGGLLGGLTGGGDSSSVAVPDVSSLTDVVNQVLATVTQILNSITSLNGNLGGSVGVGGGTVGGNAGGSADLSGLVATLTSQIQSLLALLGNIQSIATAILGSNPGQAEVQQVQALLDQVYNAVKQVVAGLTTLSSQNLLGGALTPVLQLVTQIVTSLGGLLSLSLDVGA